MPRTISGVRLSSEQLATLERCAEKVKNVKEPYAVCVEAFKRSHKIVGSGKNRRWVEKEKKKK